MGIKNLFRRIPLKYRLKYHHAVKYFWALNSIPFPSKKVILYGSGRSGSTLLTSLLNSHPDIYFDHEIFAAKTAPNIWFPKTYIKLLSKRATLHGASVYGAGLMSTQLNGQRYMEQINFLESLSSRKWHFIHIRRENILKVVLSLLRAKYDQEWESKKMNNQKIEYPPTSVIQLIRHHEQLYSIEDEIMKKIPHVKVIYERDLEKGNWEIITNKIYDSLNLERVTPFSSLKKKTFGSISDIIENDKQIIQVLKDNNYNKYLF